MRAFAVKGPDNYTWVANRATNEEEARTAYQYFHLPDAFNPEELVVVPIEITELPLSGAQGETPRTDAEIRDFGYRDDAGNWNQQDGVDIFFARQLERELAASNTALGTHAAENVKLKWELSALRQETKPELLVHAAELLEYQADVLFHSTTDKEGNWSDDPIDEGLEEQHQDYLRTAASLRRQGAEGDG